MSTKNGLTVSKFGASIFYNFYGVYVNIINSFKANLKIPIINP